MRYFDTGNRLAMDACAQDVRAAENQSIIDYQTTNFLNSCSKREEATLLVAEYPSLRQNAGYGSVDCEFIDIDSKLKLQDTLRAKDHQQLNTRLFYAVPNLGKGSCAPQLESQLLTGVDTDLVNDCGNLAEYTLPVVAPLTHCMSSFIAGAGRALPDTFSIGQSSKDIWMQQRKSKENKC